MYRRSFILVFLFLSYLSLAQSVVNVSGFSSTVMGNTYEFNLGEVAIQTLRSPILHLTQGFLQPLPLVVGTAFKEIQSDISCSFYPNPLHETLHIRFETSLAFPILIHCFNPMGQLVRELNLPFAPEGQCTTIQTKDWIPGMYRIVLQHQKKNTPLTRYFNVHKF